MKYLYFENLAGHAGDLGAETRSHCHQQLPQIKQQLWVTSDPRGHLPLAGTLERWFQSAVVSIADSLHGILDSLLDSLPPGASQPSLPICRFAAVPYPGMASFGQLSFTSSNLRLLRSRLASEGSNRRRQPLAPVGH